MCIRDSDRTAGGLAPADLGGKTGAGKQRVAALVQAAFYDDPRVLTISLHESGYTLFPGTGFPTEIGGGEATGSAVNVALPAGTADGGWLRAFHAVVPPLLREFRPEIMLSQHGCDSHRLDPLADLMLTVDGQQAAHSALHDLAHEICGGRWIAVGGGGYEVVQVVPRSWTQLLAVATGGALDPSTEVPPGWREFVATRSKQPPPVLLGDGTAPSYSHWEPGEGDVDSPLDLAVAATRRAVWPLHGLDPGGPCSRHGARALSPALGGRHRARRRRHGAPAPDHSGRRRPAGQVPRHAVGAVHLLPVLRLLPGAVRPRRPPVHHRGPPRPLRAGRRPRRRAHRRGPLRPHPGHRRRGGCLRGRRCPPGPRDRLGGARAPRRGGPGERRPPVRRRTSS